MKETAHGLAVGCGEIADSGLLQSAIEGGPVSVRVRADVPASHSGEEQVPAAIEAPDGTAEPGATQDGTAELRDAIPDGVEVSDATGDAPGAWDELRAWAAA